MSPPPPLSALYDSLSLSLRSPGSSLPLLRLSSFQSLLLLASTLPPPPGPSSLPSTPSPLPTLPPQSP